MTFPPALGFTSPTGAAVAAAPEVSVAAAFSPLAQATSEATASNNVSSFFIIVLELLVKLARVNSHARRDPCVGQKSFFWNARLPARSGTNTQAAMARQVTATPIDLPKNFCIT